jgi:4-carboxymuconolactone decarboxylase
MNMKKLAGAMLALAFSANMAWAADAAPRAASVSPALEKYSREALDKLWRQPDLAPRERSIATLAILIARNQPAELPRYLNRALDSGVQPGEISEIITHLAFYSGWGDAMAAVEPAGKVFAARGIGAGQLPAASPKLLAIDAAAEAKRVARVEKSAGPVAPGLVRDTTELLFNDLWLRPGLAPRDRSLVTSAR